ncbi:hypothetical protein BH10ACI3_BH10ACI3_08450 [soil metagenome]
MGKSLLLRRFYCYFKYYSGYRTPVAIAPGNHAEACTLSGPFPNTNNFQNKIKK